MKLTNHIIKPIKKLFRKPVKELLIIPVKKPVQNYLIFFSILLILLTLLWQILLPDSKFALADVFVYMACSLAAYLAFRLILWVDDRRWAHKINARLKAMKEEQKDRQGKN